MMKIDAPEELLLTKANVAADALRSKALESAIALENLVDSRPSGSDVNAKALLNKAVEDAKKLLFEATQEAVSLLAIATELAEAQKELLLIKANIAAAEAKKLLDIAAELASADKESLLVKASVPTAEVEEILAKAAALAEGQKESLLLKAKIAAEVLRSKAFKNSLALASFTKSRPDPADLKAKELLNDAVEDAKTLLNAATQEAVALLAIATETAKSLLLREKKLEEELFKSRKLESIGLLAGGIAHDFNNILTGVFGNLELAKRKLPPEHAAYQHLQTADKALDRAINLTNQLLTFAKGGDPLFEIIDAKQIIHDAIQFSLSGSSVRNIVTLQQDLWMINADKGQLSQIVINLVINACQAMPGGGTLTVEAINSQEFATNPSLYLSGEHVCIKISDNGVGISEEHQERIFDPYFTTKESGSGLGLSTVHSIVARHNGYIGVESALGEGTTFIIYLPAERDAQILDNAFVNGTHSSLENSGNILIMDDEQMILDMSKEMLISLGYSVETAIDGKDAVEKYIDAEKFGRPFDAIIMDLTIPGGMGGEEVMKEILGINPRVKAIASSGYSSSQVMSNYTDYGFQGRLVKPFRLDDLGNELLKILH